MKCKVCGEESGKYYLCKKCNEKKDQGLIIKCIKCGQWHFKDYDCQAHSEMPKDTTANEVAFLYEPRKSLIAYSEKAYYDALKKSVPEGYSVFPQVNLAAFVNRNDGARYHNELFRNIDFLITNADYKPAIAVEINDQSHLNSERQERDKKVGMILEECGIPMLKLWTSYGVKEDYIKCRISELLNAPVKRIHHFDELSSKNIIQNDPLPEFINNTSNKKKKNGCYIATCVYGSYDCPQVWALRRYRDHSLSKNIFGRAFIRVYYGISPFIVRAFGKYKLFHKFWKRVLDNKVKKLMNKGFDGTPYND